MRIVRTITKIVKKSILKIPCYWLSTLRKHSKLYPSLACGKLPRTIHLQTRHRCTAGRRDTQDFRPLNVYPEVLFPCVNTRMEERSFGMAFFVPACLEVRFEEVASMTSKRKIAEIISTTTRLRYDMLYFKREVKNYLRRMTVFAAVNGSLGNDWVQRVHGLRRRTRCSVRATVASNSASMRASSSARSSAVNVVRRSRSSRIRLYCASVKYASG